ncbi:hypothetical protein DYB31_015807, partial [Aphanomyces astaci]
LVGAGSKQPKTMRTGPRTGKKKGGKKDTDEPAKGSNNKVKTVWHDPKATISKKDMAGLDRSREEGGGVDDDDHEEEEGTDSILDRDDVAPVVEQFRQLLISKNVASEVAQDMCESVISTMIGQRLESFTRYVYIMIAACDTFRSGAVEQLNQHCKVLDVPLFERGYAKDPASVAKDAIAHGNDHGFDCVLIDTAGRMQNNEPLMRALAKLVSVNNPDLVLFVGEALVGNDGIDQLSLFDRYTHLAKLNVKTVLRSLLN